MSLFFLNVPQEATCDNENIETLAEKIGLHKPQAIV